MAKLKTVIKHEYMTIVKQPSFWISMLATPIIIAVALGLSYFGNKASEDRIEQLAQDLKNIAIVDQSGLINKDVVKAGGWSVDSGSQLNELRDDVRDGDKEALIVYPQTLSKDRKYQVYLSSDDFTKMGSVTSLADNILKTSIFLPLGSADIIALAQDGAESQITTYRNGSETAGLNEYVVPGLFVLLFFIVFMFSVGYMLTSVSEEKENRSMEMVLTYVEPKKLIVGKLLAVVYVTLTQVLFFMLIAAVAYIIMASLGNALTLPAGIELDRLVFNPLAIFFGAAYLIVGFFMFAGFMTTVAAMAPSSKEANNFSVAFYLGAFIPFYFITMILTDPENPVTKFVTYFPLTSPVVSLVRNAVGNMSTLESFLSLAVMAVFMIVSIWVAIRAFSRGALEYSSVIKLGSLFKK
jgi:ABC-2 type transport system permease protein